MNSGQTLHDRLLAAKHSISGQALAKAVCKATTEELIGPKKKHLDYLLHCLDQPNVSIPGLATLLIERTENSNAVVVFKSLVTLHHLMCHGHERFLQYLASSNTNLIKHISGMSSAFVKLYARYLNEKSLSYRSVALDFCRGKLEDQSVEKLLKNVPVLQKQLDFLLDFNVISSDLNNGVINAAFMLLYRDLIRLFICYNDAVSQLLDKFFNLNKKFAKEALEIYKNYLNRIDRINAFLKVAENVGVEKANLPDLTKTPSSLLLALEDHLASFDLKKTASSTSGSSLLVKSSPPGPAKPTTDSNSNPFAAECQVDSAAFLDDPIFTCPEEPARISNTDLILNLFAVPKSSSGLEPCVAVDPPAKAQCDELFHFSSSNPFILSPATPHPGPSPNGQASFLTDLLLPATSRAHGSPLNSSFASRSSTPAATAGANNSSGLISGDLDQSLANLSSNLDLGFGQPTKSGGSATRGRPMNQLPTMVTSNSFNVTSPNLYSSIPANHNHNNNNNNNNNNFSKMSNNDPFGQLF